MHKVDISQYETNTTESDIYSLKEFLDNLDSWENPHKYTVIEYFPPKNNTNYQPRVYEITNLVITDIEAGMVLCDGYLEDQDETLFGNMIHNDIIYGTNVFLLSDVIMVSMNNNKITISMDYGYIQIFY